MTCWNRFTVGLFVPLAFLGGAHGAPVVTCDIAAPVLPCQIGGTTYDSFVGNYTRNRSFYRSDSYSVERSSEAVNLTVLPSFPHNHGFAYVAGGFGPTVWTSPAPFSANFRAFGSFHGSGVLRTGGFEWIGVGAPPAFFPATSVSVPGLFDGASTNGIQYEFASANGQITIGVDIGLKGHIDPALIQAWESGIESTWSNQYAVFDGATPYPILFDVRFLTDQTQGNPDWIVTVNQSGDDWRTDNWYTSLPVGACNDAGGMGRAAAHEFGHYLGLYDEYPSHPRHPVAHGPFGVRDDGLMGVCITQSVQERYFGPDGFDVIGYLDGLTDHDIVLGRLPWTTSTGSLPSSDYEPFDRAETLNATPEPSLLHLTLIALLVALLSGRARR